MLKERLGDLDETENYCNLTKSYTCLSGSISDQSSMIKPPTNRVPSSLHCLNETPFRSTLADTTEPKKIMTCHDQTERVYFLPYYQGLVFF